MEAKAGEARSTAEIQIIVKDVNEFSPSFRRPVYETQITEEDDRRLPKPIIKVR